MYEKLYSLGVNYLNAAGDVRANLALLQKEKTEHTEKQFDKTGNKFDKIDEKLESELIKRGTRT